jgi:AbrB family looped-hinge helix DNA binding protein
MGVKVNLDDRGRITLPKFIRDKYGLNEGDELVLEEIDGSINIKIKEKDFTRIKANIDWKNVGFFKTGEVSFEE